jgi:hypothetical protein
MEQSTSDVSAIQRTPTGDSPLPGADRLSGLLSEAEALLRETAMTAALASAAANKHDPFMDDILAGVCSASAAAAHGDVLAPLALLPEDAAGAQELSSSPAAGGAFNLAGDVLASAPQAAHVPQDFPAPSVIRTTSANADHCSTKGQWVADGRKWGGVDLGMQLEEICRELDEVVGLTTARNVEGTRSETLSCHPSSLWPLPRPMGH